MHTLISESFHDFKVKHFPMGLLVNAKKKKTNPAKLASGWNKQTKPNLFLLSNKKLKINLFCNQLEVFLER